MALYAAYFFRFIDFMKDWNKFHRSDFMEIAFSAEKSVEDELDRVSKAESFIIAISYALMFIYIALALGKFDSFSKCLVRILFSEIKTRIRRCIFV